MTERTHAYILGQKDNEDGFPRTANPYRFSPKCEQWAAGWDAAQITRDQWEQDNYERCSTEAA